MNARNSFWPRDMPRHLAVPEGTIFDNLAISATRYPSRPAIHFFGRDITYREMLNQVERLTGWLQRRADLVKGERVALFMQNSPQWLITYYGVLRAGGVIVPVNPMNTPSEVRHYLKDSGARLVICAQELQDVLSQATEGDNDLRAIVATYADYLPRSQAYALPDWITAAPDVRSGNTSWHTMLTADEAPFAVAVSGDDPCGFFYTSGSTGRPKACVLTHRAYLHNIIGQALWHLTAPGTAVLASSPMFHVSGLNHGVHLPVYVGGTAVVLPRWDSALALRLIEAQRIGHATIPVTALIDLLSHPDFALRDLSSLRRLTAGGAAMPEAVAVRLRQAMGLDFIEAYGLTETAATTHLNPVHRPKLGSLGIPFFGTEAIVVDGETLELLPQGRVGEILVRGPQLFECYWNRPDDTTASFVEVEGKRYFRTGDIGCIDEEGYFFMKDRAKRMINAAGYKVWPAEVESTLYEHAAIKEVCVIGTHDPYRGETVKAVVVLHAANTLDETGLISWARKRMAAYKYPRVVEFVDALPKSDIGKVLWRELQDRENARVVPPDTCPHTHTGVNHAYSHPAHSRTELLGPSL